MEIHIFVAVGCSCFLLAVFIEFLGWKVWRHLFKQDFTQKLDACIVILFFDPLLSSISFPLASDLYFYLDWAGSCGAIFSLTVICVLLILYSSALLLSYNVITILIPATHHTRENSHLNNVALCCGVSVFISCIFTWILLCISGKYPEGFHASEDCWQGLLYKNVYFIFEATFTFQFAILCLYVHFGVCVLRKSKIMSLPGEQSFEDKNQLQSGIFICSAIIIICLFIANVFRSSFSECSCYSFSNMASALVKNNFIISIKASVVGIAWSLFSLFRNNILRT